jgi:hypothetical protein
VSVTPIGRLDAMEQQFTALEDAIHLVRPALETFYASLSDEQKERFNALGPAAQSARNARTNRQRTRGASVPQADRLARACQDGGALPGDLPIERIEQVVQPDQTQRAALEALRSASTDAAKIVASACPTEMPLTPTGRLAQMERRIDAMLGATKTLRPALSKFYAALNDEQRARFNRTILGGTRRAG